MHLASPKTKSGLAASAGSGTAVGRRSALRTFIQAVFSITFIAVVGFVASGALTFSQTAGSVVYSTEPLVALVEAVEKAVISHTTSHAGRYSAYPHLTSDRYALLSDNATGRD